MHFTDFNAFIASLTAVNISFGFFFVFEKSAIRAIKKWFKLQKEEYKAFIAVTNSWASDTHKFKAKFVKKEYKKAKKHKKSSLFPTKLIESTFIMASITGMLLLLFNALIDRNLASFQISYSIINVTNILFIITVFLAAFTDIVKINRISAWVVVTITLYILIVSMLNSFDRSNNLSNSFTIFFMSLGVLLPIVSHFTDIEKFQNIVFLISSLITTIIYCIFQKSVIIFDPRTNLYLGLVGLTLPLLLTILSFSIKVVFVWFKFIYLNIKIKAVSIGAYDMPLFGNEYNRLAKVLLKQVYNNSIIKRDDSFLKIVIWAIITLLFVIIFFIIDWLSNYIF